MAKKKGEKKEIKKDSAMISYIFGIISIVLAFFTPMAGLIFGIIGLVQSKKQKDDLSIRAKKLSTLGIILSLVFLVVALAITAYASLKGLNSSGIF